MGLFGPNNKYSGSTEDTPESTKNYAARPTGELFGAKEYAAIDEAGRGIGDTYTLVEQDDTIYLRRGSDGTLVEPGVPAGGGGGTQIGFLPPGHEDHSGGSNDGEIILGDSDGNIISALPVDVRANGTIIDGDNGLIGVDNGRIVFNVSTVVQAGDERPVNSAAVQTALDALPPGHEDIGGILSISSTPDKVAEIGIYDTDSARIGQQFVISTVDSINNTQDININSEPSSGSSTEQLAQRLELTLNKATVPAENDARPITSDAVNTAIQGLGPGEHVAVQDDSIQQVAAATVLDFTGDGVTVTGDGNKATINIPDTGSDVATFEVGVPYAAGENFTAGNKLYAVNGATEGFANLAAAISNSTLLVDGDIGSGSDVAAFVAGQAYADGENFTADNNLYAVNGASAGFANAAAAISNSTLLVDSEITSFSSTVPPNPVRGDLWIDLDDGVESVWDGVQWVQTGGPGVVVSDSTDPIPETPVDTDVIELTNGWSIQAATEGLVFLNGTTALMLIKTDGDTEIAGDPGGTETISYTPPVASGIFTFAEGWQIASATQGLTFVRNNVAQAQLQPNGDYLAIGSVGGNFGTISYTLP